MKNDFYEANATTFFEETVHAEMNMHYKPFLELLPMGASILDAGCGSGRDSLAFKRLGYQVTAIDKSKEMCKLAQAYIGQEVKTMSFQELKDEACFDGIWACATLLHVPSKELPEVMKRFWVALKSKGILYASFKYGDFEGERKGRYFNDFTEEKLEAVLKEGELKLIKMWITGDVRAHRVDEKWLNVLCKKE